MGCVLAVTRTLHCMCMCCLLCLSVQYKRNQIRKGMVLVATALNPKSCWEFEGDILVLHHPTTISCKYQAMGEPHSTGGGARMV